MCAARVDRNDWALDRLELSDASRVLEIGFGPGKALRALLRRCPGVEAYGVDRSPVALERAEAWGSGIDGRRLHLACLALEDLSARFGLFDRILAINVNAFWLRPPAALPPVLSCLAPGGIFLVAYEAPSKTRAGEIGAALEAAATSATGVRLSIEHDAERPLVAARLKRDGNHAGS